MGSSRFILVGLATLMGSSRFILVGLATLTGSSRLILDGLGNQKKLVPQGKDLKCVVRVVCRLSSIVRRPSVIRRLYLLSSHVSTLVHCISNFTLRRRSRYFLRKYPKLDTIVVKKYYDYSPISTTTERS